MTLEGHSGMVTSVAFSPDGGLLASASGDHTIKLWDPQTGEQLRTLEGHSDSVLSVAFSPDGGLLVSASRDDTIKLWDPQTGEHLRTLEGHSHSVESVAFSPDGELLASASWDQTIKLWDPQTGEHLRTLEGHSDSVLSVAFSPDGGLMASASLDHTIKLWDPQTGEHLRTLEGHSHSVLSVAFFPDGGLLTSASQDQAPSDLHMTKVLQSLSPIGPLYVHSTDAQRRSLVHNAHTGQLVQADGKSSFPEINHDQHLFTLEGHWLCAGAAYIFYLPLAFLVSTWKHQGPFVCFGSQGGDILILDVSPAINTLATM